MDENSDRTQVEYWYERLEAYARDDLDWFKIYVHDLRNPAHTVARAVELLLDPSEDTTEEEKTKLFDIILKQSQIVHALVEAGVKYAHSRHL